jgi:hypothetical protein
VIEPVELRPATGCDHAELERLAQLDSARVPGGRLLVAEASGSLVAALSMDSGEAIADPFAPTAHLVAALRAQGARSEGGRAWTRPSRLQPAT